MIPDRPTLTTSEKDLRWLITDDGSRTLENVQLQETYHSGCGAIAETMTVYLCNSRVWGMLRQSQPASVLEYGLGTATAFLLSAAAAETLQTPLTYFAAENRLLPKAIFAELQITRAAKTYLTQDKARWESLSDEHTLAKFLQNLELVHQRFLDWVTTLEGSLSDTVVRTQLSQFASLELWLGDALEIPVDWPPSALDAIYFDPFAPSISPDLWCCKAYTAAFERLRPGGILASYCVKHAVRKEMESCGFEVLRKPGPPGGKREVLVAVKPGLDS